MMQKNSLHRLASVTAALSVTLLSSCQFKSPTVAEQKYLVEKGAFPAGTPGWIATPLAGGALPGGGSYSGGLIPQTFTGSTPHQNRSAAPTAEESRSSAGTFKIPTALAEKKEVEDDKDASSPLHRIAKLCPSVESEVNDALITVDLKQRIRKYESLTLRCPQSADLWLWLGKDYSKDGEDVKAGRSFEKVLVIDATNKEASDLLTENRKKLNGTSDKKPGNTEAH
ncbi:MAG: hypothetical protein U0136_17305 [Bdellovibrionota bacterium]